MSTIAPRAVFIARQTEYEQLIARHGTRDQVGFFLSTRGQTLDAAERRHAHFLAVLKSARAMVPAEWRATLVRRDDLDRFMFAPEDIVIAVGQDGLIANVAKYLRGQPVLGVNPDPALNDGVLARLQPADIGQLLPRVVAADCAFETRTMVEAQLDDGQKLLALNEIFVGHRSHQSARYEISVGKKSEAQSSSGFIVATGTGATGWARSIMESVKIELAPDPAAPSLAYFVREPFPSVSTGTSIKHGKLPDGSHLTATSRMNDGGVVFADGIEHDHLVFEWGRRVEIGISKSQLRLVIGN
jgi:hypothetical protein